MKKNLQFMRVHTRSLFLWAWLVLLSLSLTDALGQATLPARHDGPWQGMNKTGWTQTGLGVDYSSEMGGNSIGASSSGGTANFDGVGDNIIVNFTGSPGALTYFASYSGISTAFGGTVLVEESADGSAYTVLRTIAADLKRANANTAITDYPSSTSRYIRFRFIAKNGTQNFQLDGVHIAANNGPEINIRQGAVDYLTGSTYTFATQNVKTTGNAIAFTILNTGTVDLNLSGMPLVSIAGTNANEFKIDQSATSATVAPGGNTTYTVSFAPTSFGNKTATITVLNNDSNEGTYTINLTGSADILPATISNISPASGQIGNTVVISGTNLINTTDVTFNGTAASFVINNDGQITTTVPAGASSGAINVSNAKSSVNGPTFTVVSQPAPTISGFTPASGPIGQTVIITGTDFTGATSVKFNAVPAAYTVNSNTQITATVPASATTGSITITTSGGTVASANNFNVLLLPEIHAISPDFGSVGDIITITGINFTGATDVSFSNGLPAAYEVNSDGEIIAEVPVGAVTGPISITTTGGTATSETFTIVVSAPFISEVTPSAAMAGEIITITGVNFSGATDVRFNGEIAAYEVISDGEIIAEVPTGVAAGPVVVTVTTTGSTANNETFTLVVPAPAITSISPSSGKIGALVTITGTNFANAVNVSFNGTSASFTVDNDSQITVQVPNGATSGPVTVTTAGGAASSDIFNVIVPNTTYTWNVGSGNWTDPNSWTPVRNTLTNADILIFDGSKTTNPTVNLDFASSQTVGQLKFINSVIANLHVAADKSLILDNGVTGADLDIAANSSVTIDNTSPDAELTLRVTAGETGVIAGTLALRGGAGIAEHRIFTEEVDGLIFQNGSTFRTGLNFSGNPFGTINLNTVRFASGATYRNAAGGSPFGAAAPNSVLIFDPGSLYRHESNTAPDLNDRTYSNFELNNAAFEQTVAGIGNLNLNNLTITNAINFNLNLSGNINISGNINAVAGALNFNPGSANNINMSVNGTKIIYGSGILTLGANARLNVPVGITVDLRKQISGTGQVIVDGAIKTNVEEGFAGGAATALNSGVTPVLNAGSVVEYNALGAQTVSPIDYRNLIISGNRSGNTVTLAPGTIKIAEAFTIPATIVTYSANNNTVEFNGGSQIIPVLPYHNLVAAGTAAKSLAGNIPVNGNVNVIAATINTGANRIILNNTASLSESQTSYIMGKVEATRNVTAGFTQNFGGVGLTLAPTAGSLSPGTTRVVRSTGIAAIQLNEERQSITRVYDITAANSTGLNTAITLKYAPNELSSGQDEAKLSMYKKEGANPWLEQAGSYTRTPVQRTISLMGVTGFSSWTLGEQSILLPVELVQFTATRRGQNVQLNWATAMELNNKGFEVQVSADAQNFEPVSFVDSKNSNSKELQQYSFLDSKTKPADVLYYRLKQVDFDGTETYSAVKAVTYKKEQIAITATAYPNPFDESFTVVVNADAQKIASLTITDAVGKKVMEKTVTLTKGSNDVRFNLGNQYPSGIYIINITTNNFQQNLKMVKK
ncbi:IPT/TIG domain-containing protein [Adhaeribacter rhizoryzae]|uniref:Choice-of-anchor D domain-containing protein n=1 Tax=Adhaeribacter rhizoryzae TaxID=2607907 RepID=A0A5M6DJV2_9BACT|nr:IPT/TIG domain-containing protein [Adhaeribacter rhizoryzae]KAA5546542.1 choice-of-anchor D domain-containing protein [Adhaeribacter rhizoryzae]